MQKSPSSDAKRQTPVVFKFSKAVKHAGACIHRQQGLHLKRGFGRNLLAGSRQLDYSRPKRRVMCDGRRSTDGALRIGNEGHVKRTGRT
jgi:hypothetical protein